ncbi:MAG: response regulator [Nitrospirae bacterium]|nr:response regulator [Nitrospirota bacterium]
MGGAELKRIMLVEDDLSIQMVAKVSLESVGGFTVKVCSSGAEALREVGPFKPDLVLMDVMMPEMDGPTTLRAMRGSRDLAGIPVVFITAKAQPQEVAHFRSLGAIDIITKPFDPMSLPGRVREIWGRAASGATP